MKYFRLEQTDEKLTLEETTRGRLAAALGRFAVSFPLVFLGLSFFFIPDYIGRYAEAEPVPGLFWLVVFAVAILIALILATLRFVRFERWTFDRKKGEIVYQTHGLYGAGVEAAVKLDQITRVGLERRSPPLESFVVIDLTDGHREIIARRRGAIVELETIVTSVEALLGPAQLARERDSRVDYPSDVD
jgi:hypothetical protein